MDVKDFIYLIDKIDKKIIKNKKYLTELDLVIGDGDHGVNISNIFTIVNKKINKKEFGDWGEILNFIGITILSEVEGRAGTLYGNAFMDSALIGEGKSEITICDYRDIMKISIDGIKMRGKASKGDKTMLDALIPAYEEICYGIENDISTLNTLKNSIEVARNSVEYTKLIATKKGKGSNQGHRSIGYKDPGATSVLMILEVVYEVVKELKG